MDLRAGRCLAKRNCFIFSPLGCAGGGGGGKGPGYLIHEYVST